MYKIDGPPKWSRRKLGRLTGNLRSHSARGQALIEFLLIVLLFFFLIFALMDFAWMMFAQMNLQDAVREAGRYASTGNHLANPTNPGMTLSRTDSITQVITKYAEGVEIDNVSISSASGGAGNAGGPGDTVTITVMADVPFLTTAISKFFGGRYYFTVTSSFKNEPFPPTQTK